MKKLFLTVAICLPIVIGIMPYSLFSQSYCGSSRYDSEIFPNVTTTSDVIYGSNADLNGSTVSLTMDIYQPTGDVATQRPLIIFAHGGSFIGGSKTDADEVTLATRFAKRGYVTASIYYRLGMGFPINQANAQKAVWRAVQDMKAAVRFFRKDAATTNTYKIDPNYVFVGGYSAGAFTAVHYAYLDQPSEIPTAIDTNLLGGLQGNSGNPGYSTAINGVLNFAGAIGDTLWMHAGDKPMVTAQGNNDGTVPYCKATISVSGFPIMPVNGGGSMHIRCYNVGIYNPIHTYYGQDHPASVSASAPNNIDTTIILASDFVYKQLGCTPVNTAIYTNNQTCTSTLTGIGNTIVLNDENVSVFPNPASENLTLILKNVKGNKFSVQIFDITGREVKKIAFSEKDIIITRNNIQNGFYFLKMTSDAGELFVTKFIFTE